MKLILFTATKCSKCPVVKKIVKEIADELGWTEGNDYAIKNVDEGDNLVEALTYQVASTPSIVLNGEPAYVGEIPNKKELLEKLK